MLPYGQAVRPEVAIGFDLGGGPWQLRKAFCQKPEAELFGFTPPKKGQSKA